MKKEQRKLDAEKLSKDEELAIELYQAEAKRLQEQDEDCIKLEQIYKDAVATQQAFLRVMEDTDQYKETTITFTGEDMKLLRMAFLTFQSMCEKWGAALSETDPTIKAIQKFGFKTDGAGAFMTNVEAIAKAYTEYQTKVQFKAENFLRENHADLVTRIAEAHKNDK